MKWFEGGIPAAIQAAKASKSVFIVFISGDDEKSKEMEEYLQTEEVTRVCEENNCVAIKLEKDSNDCKFFSQIYPVVVIPSTFFIGDTGVPLEVIGECKSHEDFLAKVRQAVELQKKSSASGGASPQSSSQQSQEKVLDSPKPVAEVVDVDSLGSSATGSGDDAVAEEILQLDERVENAKRLIDMKKEEKAKQEAEEAKRKERERRTVGQGVQKLREQQKEMELLEAKKELKRDRDEDKLARQRVKEEIERDRAEKAARFSKEKDERTKATEEQRKKKLLEQQAAQAQEAARRSDIARIQFRLPDGSSISHQFDATDTFSTVHQFITQHMGSNVNLSMAFPRRTFTQEDHSLTLQELQLAPSAVILVIPGGVSTSAVRSSSGILSVSGITSLILAPVMFIWNMLASILGFSGPSSSSVTSGAGASSSVRSSATGGDRNRGSAYKRPASTSRQEGSVRRFRNAQDDEDDEDRSTWNGNSTQQM